MPEVVAFDESGNTGDNLLDAAQPIYALGSVHVAEADAAALIAEVAPQQGELHYNKAPAEPSGAGRSHPDTARAPALGRNCARHAYAQALFCGGTLFRLLDGADALRGRARRIRRVAPCAVCKSALPTGSRGLRRFSLGATLETFVAACRTPTRSNTAALASANAECVAVATDEAVARLLMLVPPAGDQIRALTAVDQGFGIGMRDMLDPAATSLMENCITWPERIGRIVVLHDASNVVARWCDRLRALASPQAEQILGPYWAQRLPHPLAIDEVRLADSANSARLQLADIVAGVGVTWLAQFVPGRSYNQAFVAELTELGVEELVENPVWPDAQMATVPF